MSRKSNKAPIRVPRAQWLSELRGTPLTVVVWSAAVAALALMLSGRASQVEYVGVARATYYEVSPSAAGRIDRLFVELYERVEAGDIVATLDASEVRARLETAKAELRRLGAELDAVSRGSDPDRIDQRADLRRFELDVENRHLQALTLKVQIESDEIEAQRLALQARRLQALHDDGIISDDELDDVRLRHHEVKTRVAENRILLAKLREEHATALERKRQFEGSLPFGTGRLDALVPLRLSVQVQERRIEEVEVEREQLVLRSPVSGQISNVIGTPGQAVRPGEPIVTVARSFATEVVGYLAGEASHDPTGRTVALYRVADPQRIVESVVLRASPTIELLPEQLWRVPGRAEYGRAFTIAATPDLRLLPGEPVHIRIASNEQ